MEWYKILFWVLNGSILIGLLAIFSAALIAFIRDHIEYKKAMKEKEEETRRIVEQYKNNNHAVSLEERIKKINGDIWQIETMSDGLVRIWNGETVFMAKIDIDNETITFAENEKENTQ